MKAGTQNHLKVKRLQRLLGVPMYRAVGILESLWLLCLDCCDDGRIGKFSDDEIADYLGWDGSKIASELVRALSDAGWLDPDDECRYVIHDWLDHCPEYIKDRIRKRGARVEKRRKSTTYVQVEPDAAGTLPDKPGQTPDQAGLVPSIPNPTQPITTQPNPTNTLSANADEVTIDDLVAAWNETSGVIQCRSITKQRIAALKIRLKDQVWVEGWEESLTHFPLRCFQGESDPWRPDLDWFLKPGNVLKILEGKYDFEKSNGRQRGLPIGPGQTHPEDAGKW